MSFQNDSRKGGAHGKTGGNTKGGQAKAGQRPSSGQQGKVGLGGQHGQAGQGGQHGRTAQHPSGGLSQRGGNTSQQAGGGFHPQDIKSLVHNQGRARLCGQEWALKTPSWNDSALQAIISDPKFTAKAAGKPAADGKVTYELSGHGKTIKVTIGH